jgi:hypothetical protein
MSRGALIKKLECDRQRGCQCADIATYDDMQVGRWFKSLQIECVHEGGFHQAMPSAYTHTRLQHDYTLSYHKFVHMSNEEAERLTAAGKKVGGCSVEGTKTLYLEHLEELEGLGGQKEGSNKEGNKEGNKEETEEAAKEANSLEGGYNACSLIKQEDKKEGASQQQLREVRRATFDAVLAAYSAHHTAAMQEWRQRMASIGASMEGGQYPWCAAERGTSSAGIKPPPSIVFEAVAGVGDTSESMAIVFREALATGRLFFVSWHLEGLSTASTPGTTAALSPVGFDWTVEAGITAGIVCPKTAPSPKAVSTSIDSMWVAGQWIPPEMQEVLANGYCQGWADKRHVLAEPYYLHSMLQPSDEVLQLMAPSMAQVGRRTCCSDQLLSMQLVVSAPVSAAHITVCTPTANTYTPPSSSSASG